MGNWAKVGGRVVCAVGILAAMWGPWFTFGPAVVGLRGIYLLDSRIGTPQGLYGMLGSLVTVAGFALVLALLGRAAMEVLQAEFPPFVLQAFRYGAPLFVAAAAMLFVAKPELVGESAAFATGMGLAVESSAQWGFYLALASGIASLFVWPDGTAEPLSSSATYVPVKASPSATSNAHGSVPVAAASAGAAAGSTGASRTAGATAVASDQVIYEASRKMASGGMASASGADATKHHLRFAVEHGELHANGLTIRVGRQPERHVSWAEFAKAVAFRMPADPPFEKALVVDLQTNGGPPVRLLQSTRINWHALPGGARPRASENLRALIQLIQQKQPTLQIDPPTVAFCQRGELPPIFAGIRLFQEYDRQY